MYEHKSRNEARRPSLLDPRPQTPLHTHLMLVTLRSRWATRRLPGRRWSKHMAASGSARALKAGVARYGPSRKHTTGSDANAAVAL